MGASSQDPLDPPVHWPVHDTNRPLPAVVAPPGIGSANHPGSPHSDAFVSFDGEDLSQWRREAWPDDPDKSEQPRWKVEVGQRLASPGRVATL